MVDIEAINVVERQALLTDGRLVPITTFFDALGDECAPDANAISFVAGEGRDWFSAPLADFERVPTQ